MTNRQKRFTRKPGVWRYKKIFFIVSEGKKSEPQYFNMLNNPASVIRVKCISKSSTDNYPAALLRKMSSFLNTNSIRTSDEAWIVVDKDSWKENDLNQLFQWSTKKPNYGLAVSNPKFEYWLLLHFENGDNIGSASDVDTRLNSCIPCYDKHIQHSKFPMVNVKQAITRAKTRDYPPCSDWPREIGQTTVYRLVEKILQTENQNQGLL